MTFLLAEDSRPARNLIKNYLGELNLGHYLHFFEAESAEIAYDMVKKHHVDFVLVDWNLATSMTGLDLLKEIRKIEKFKELPIVMVTSETDKISVIDALKYGANDFIAKPIIQKQFKEKILRIIVGLK
ncbi:MAG: response regulator [Treponema sp.]|jgi:two-component system chemotaxis response regulator CheY|nr:response regulator [Treponema sp.]